MAPGTANHASSSKAQPSRSQSRGSNADEAMVPWSQVEALLQMTRDALAAKNNATEALVAERLQEGTKDLAMQVRWDVYRATIHRESLVVSYSHKDAKEHSLLLVCTTSGTKFSETDTHFLLTAVQRVKRKAIFCVIGWLSQAQ